MASLVAILRGARVTPVQLLPYNPMGVVMVDKLGRRCPALPASLVKPQEIERIERMFSEVVDASKSRCPG